MASRILSNHEKDLIGPERPLSYFAGKHNFTEGELERFSNPKKGDAICDYAGSIAAQTSVILEDRERGRSAATYSKEVKDRSLETFGVKAMVERGKTYNITDCSLEDFAAKVAMKQAA